MKILIPLRSVLFISISLLSSLHVLGQNESEAISKALELYPEANTLWEAIGKSNSFDVDFVITDPSCNGGSDGSICAVPVVPGNYFYFWFHNGSTDSCTFDEDAGSYSLQVTNLATNESCLFFPELSEPPIIGVFGMTQTAPTCVADCNGQAEPIAGGGTGQLSYLYSSGETTPIGTMLCNPFTLTLTDENGCSVDSTFTFSPSPDTLEITAVVNNISCMGLMDGAIDATVTGGTGAIVHSWEYMEAMFSDDEDIDMLAAGHYTLSIVDDNGCTTDSTFTILDAVPITLDSEVTDILCNGDSTGAIMLDVFGGDSTYTFAWTGPDSYTSSDEDIDELIAGTYNLTITDGLNCDKDTFFIINQNLPIDISAVITEIDCHDSLTGAIDVTVSGPFPIIDFSWTVDIVAATEDISDIGPGTYALAVTDDQGCVADSTFVLENPDEIELSFDITDILCAGENSGSIDLEATGGTGNLTYLWTPLNVNTEDIDNLLAGDYTIVVTDENDCMASSTITINEPLPINADATITPVSCGGEDDGNITVVVTGGTGIPTLVWNPFEPIDAPAGTYILTVTDENDCVETYNYEITEPDAIMVDITVTDVSCNGLTDGSIVVIATGGTGELDLVWTPAIDPTAVPAGDYLLTVTDENDCSLDTLISVAEPIAIDLSVDISHVICAGDANGAVDLTATGGSGNFDYQWSPPGNQITQDISGLSGGSYTVVVTDQMNCTEEITAIVDEPDPITVDETITNVSCSGGDDGSIIVLINGGTGAYNITWLPEEPVNVGAGTYTLTVRDKNLCEETFVYDIQEANPIIFDVEVTHVSCNGLSDGTISASASGGIGDLTLAWAPPIDPDNVAAGDYTLTVTDESNCVKDTLITIDEPAEIFIDLDVTDLACFGDADGAIDITPLGGTGDYDYDWTGPPGPYNPTAQDISGLSAGSYTVIVSDENNCTESITAEVDEPLSIEVEAIITEIDCDGDDSGSIDITASNGSGVFTYVWSGPSITGANVNDEDVFDLLSGIYMLTVSDENMCSLDTMFEIVASNPIIVTETISDVLCFGDSTGAIVLDVTGGTGTLDYTWTNGDGISGSNQNLSGIPAGTYTVTITDDLGCVLELDFTVNQASPITLFVFSSNLLCFGDETGTIDVSVSGDYPDFNHAWTGPPGFTPVAGIGLDLEDLGAGTYSLIVTDAVGCTAVNSYTLTEPTDLEVTLQLTDPICGQQNGMAEASVTGGTVAADYTYEWFDAIFNPLSSTGPIQGGLDAGAYFCLVSDDNDCSVLLPFELSDEEGSITATITDVTCFDSCDGAIDVEITGLNGALDITWNGPNGPYLTEDLLGICAGDYTINIEDALGCQLVETYTVDSPNEIILDAIIIDESCPGANDGAIDLTATGGTGTKTYLWNGLGVNDVPSQDLNGLAPGTYTVDVSDENDCVVTESFTVQAAVDYTITAVITEISCASAGDGAIDVSVSPAIVGATYVWVGNGGPYGTEDISGLDPGIYDLELTTDRFCTLNASYEILATEPIEVITTVTNSACGMNTGAVDFTITGGTVAGEYDIDVYMLPADTPVGTTDLDGGSYVYTISDDNDCMVMGSFTISDELGTLDGDINPVTCLGGSDGAIDITIQGMTGDLDIQWQFNGSPFSVDEDINMLSAGTYTVSITDENGCVLGATYVVPEGQVIDITASITDIDCNGDGDGAIAIDYSGLQGNPSFAWTYLGNPFSASEDLSDLDGGVYTIVITDDAGCQGMASFTVDEPEELTVTASITPVLCNGENTGAIDITISGGTGPYFPVWTWANGSSNFEDISGLEAGTYTLTLSDSRDCTFSMVYVVPESSPITVDILQLVNANCDMADGLIEVLAMGGNSPYNYEWTNSLNQVISSLSIADDLAAGTYTLEVTDEDLCSVSFEFTISNTNASLDADLTQPSCGLGDDGAIDLIISGDVTPLVMYTWTGPGGPYDTEDLTGLEPGTYEVLVEDGAGCIYQASFTLDEPDLIDFDVDINDVSCEGEMDGAVDITPNISGDINYLWNGPGVSNETTQDLSGLQGGDYDLTISIVGGCSAMFTYEVIEPEVLDASVLITHVNCNGGATGAIDLTVTGGTPQYDVLWMGPNGPIGFSQDINGLVPGIYTLSLIDGQNCVFDEQYEVNQAPEIVIDVVDQGPASCNSPVGFIEVEGSGGNEGFTYVWTNSADETVSQNALAEQLIADTYTVEITDATGCSLTEEYIISNEDLTLSGSVTDVSCFGLADGAIDVSQVGDIVLVDTLWTGPGGYTATSEDIADLIAGEYVVTFLDELGCTYSDSYTIDAPDEIEIESAFENLDCFSDEDGSITISDITGGSGTYTTELVDEIGEVVPGNLAYTNLAEGVYILTVTDIVPCAMEFEFTITAPEEITVDENLINPSCIGLSDGSITLNVNGGQGEYTYDWTGEVNADEEDLMNLAPGIYDLLITDDSLCTFTESYELIGVQAIDLDLDIEGIACAGDGNGSITADPAGNNDNYTFEWTVGGVPYDNVAEITELAPNTYDLQIIDETGCVLDTSIVIEDPEALAVELDALTSVSCNGDGDGAIAISTSGGTGMLDTQWTGGITSSDEDIVDLSGGTYTLTVTDDNACVTTEEYIIEEPEVLEVSLVATQDAECQNTADGIIETSVNGGTPDYEFSWQGQGDLPNTQNLIGVLPGDYILTVTDDHGCTTEGLYTLDYQIEISVDAGDYAPVCNGSEIILSGIGAPASSGFAWYVPGSTQPFTQQQITSIVPSVTNSTFILEVTNGNCIATDTTLISVLQLPTPDAGEDLEAFIDETITLGGEPWPTGNTFNWVPAEELMDSDDPNPSWIVSGTQTFILTVTDFNGCIGTDQVTITINPTVDVPDGFTPNNDGTNELWEILNTQQFPEMMVQVFNRWGDELWLSSAGYTTPWDGTYQGKELPVGTYYYVIELNDERFPEPITGPVTIFR